MLDNTGHGYKYFSNPYQKVACTQALHSFRDSVPVVKLRACC